MRINKMVYTTM